MNKTININLGGVFFHIDEDAYKILKSYLDAIRKSLSDDPQGKNEIIKDIEYRIGEILSERIVDVRQVVNQQDIEDIIIVMGKPEQYAGDDEFFEDDTSTANNIKKRKKLYRDVNDKFLGGVSSGLGHYFGIDVIWIRLGWLLLLISGFSVILYPILWILLPEANTTSEKLEMEGEPVNISNIERKIKEELSNASKLVKEGIEDVSETIKKGDYQEKVKSGLQEIIDLMAKVFTAIFKVAGKFIGILLIIFSIFSLIGLVIGGFSLGSVEFLGLAEEVTNYPPFFYTSSMPIWLLISLVFVIISIPFVLLFKLGLRIISSNVSSFSKATNLSLLGVWLLAVMGLGFAGIEYGAHYTNEFTNSDKHVLETKLQDTLKIKMFVKDNFKLNRSNSIETIIDGGIEKSYKTNVSIDIRESNTGEMYLKIYEKGHGIDIEEAKEVTNDIDYNFSVLDDVLLLDAYFLSDIKQRYKSQTVRVVLYLPKGKTIYIDKSTRHSLSDVKNIQDIYDWNMVKHYYKMIDEGLDCLDCEEQSYEESKKIYSKVKQVEVEEEIVEEEIIEGNTGDAEETHEKIKQKLRNKGATIR